MQLTLNEGIYGWSKHFKLLAFNPLVSRASEFSLEYGESENYTHLLRFSIQFFFISYGPHVKLMEMQIYYWQV
jgi:hypothetical protein